MVKKSGINWENYQQNREKSELLAIFTKKARLENKVSTNLQRKKVFTLEFLFSVNLYSLLRFRAFSIKN